MRNKKYLFQFLFLFQYIVSSAKQKNIKFDLFFFSVKHYDINNDYLIKKEGIERAVINITYFFLLIKTNKIYMII
jgi:hypothetical protein